MKGIATLIKYGLLADKKWDVKGYDFKHIIDELGESDRAIIKDLFYIGEGEFGGSSMLVDFVEKILVYPKEERHAFNEMIVFGTQILVYEEFRHGVVLKQLNAQLDGWDYVNEVDSKELAGYLISEHKIWNDPYEILVSFFTGEIVNAALYKVVADKVQHQELKAIISNIRKDEMRHKMAWFDITRNLLAENPIHKVRYVEALKRIHTVHQAEIIGDNYSKGAICVQKYFSHDAIEKIYTEKYELLHKLLGDEMPFTKFEIKEQYARSMIRHARIARGM